MTILPCPQAGRKEGVRSDPTININNSLAGLKLQVQSTSERTRGERNRNEILSSIGRRAYCVLGDLSSTVLINPIPTDKCNDRPLPCNESDLGIRCLTSRYGSSTGLGGGRGGGGVKQAMISRLLEGKSAYKSGRNKQCV